MTTTWALVIEKRAEIPGSLRRQFWLPLRRLLKMFHILPVAAAAILFGLLAFEGQLGEIYVSYLEDLGSGGVILTAIRFAVAALGFALIAAVLYEAHYRLSGPRINVIYSMNSEVGTGSRLRHVQDVSAIVIALSPWLGLVAGLLNAKASLAGLFETLRKANVDPASLQHVPSPSSGAVVAALLVLGLVMSFLAAVNLKNKTLQRAVMLTSPLAAGLMFVLLNRVPTLPTTAFIGAIAASIAALVVYYVVYYRIQMLRAYIFRVKALQEDDNFSMHQWQRIILFCWVLLPWVLVLALYFLLPAILGLESPPAGGPASNAPGAPSPSLAMIPVAMCWVVATGLLVASLLHTVRDRVAAKMWLYGIVCVLAALGLLTFWLANTEQIVTAYRLVGPLSSLAFSLLFLISVFVLLAVLSQQSAFPALTLSILVLVLSAILPLSPGWSTGLLCLLCVAVGIMAILSRLLYAAALAVLLVAIVLINYFKSEAPTLAAYSQPFGAALTQQFDTWLSSKGVPPAGGSASGTAADACFAAPTLATPTGAQYPVYIVAVEGGGIYAASAASTFLARLQDENPCFSDHLFAVSGVSGGAIGATIFQAVEQARLIKAAAAGAPSALLAERANDPVSASGPPVSTDRCDPRFGGGNQSDANVSFEREVCRIVEGDHFSPLIASIFPELLGFTSKGRPYELAASFEQSANAVDRGAGTVLNAPFAADWSDVSKAPALVLNATWVETGLRTVFAPFPLHAVDDSLYSFFDKDMPINSSQPLIQAAIVSARFPFVLPPYSVDVAVPPAHKSNGESEPDRQPVHWNFVDGGYSDSSGAATALALYKALAPSARARHVALRLILLTSSDPKLESNQITGTTFADIMGPLEAILSVRAGLANEAVARACDGVFGPNAPGAKVNTCEDRAKAGNSPLQIVGIEDQTYGLSLGWKISQTTFSVVSWMLGRAADCNTSADSREGSAQSNGKFVFNEKVVNSNSCVLRSIQEALGGTPTPNAPQKAAPAPNAQ